MAQRTFFLGTKARASALAAAQQGGGDVWVVKLGCELILGGSDVYFATHTRTSRALLNICKTGGRASGAHGPSGGNASLRPPQTEGPFSSCVFV